MKSYLQFYTEAIKSIVGNPKDVPNVYGGAQFQLKDVVMFNGMEGVVTSVTAAQPKPIEVFFKETGKKLYFTKKGEVDSRIKRYLSFVRRPGVRDPHLTMPKEYPMKNKRVYVPGYVYKNSNDLPKNYESLMFLKGDKVVVIGIKPSEGMGEIVEAYFQYVIVKNEKTGIKKKYRQPDGYEMLPNNTLGKERILLYTRPIKK